MLLRNMNDVIKWRLSANLINVYNHYNTYIWANLVEISISTKLFKLSFERSFFSRSNRFFFFRTILSSHFDFQLRLFLRFWLLFWFLRLFRLLRFYFLFFRAWRNFFLFRRLFFFSSLLFRLFRFFTGLFFTLFSKKIINRKK